MKDWRRENQKEVITTHQFITHNRLRGLGTFFNSPATYQVLQHTKEEAVITIVQTNVEELNESTSDGTRQFTQTGSLNVNHECQ